MPSSGFGRILARALGECGEGGINAAGYLHYIHPTNSKRFELTRQGAGKVTRNLTVFEIVIEFKLGSGCQLKLCQFRMTLPLPGRSGSSARQSEFDVASIENRAGSITIKTE
jgi:hypothetical protein